VILNDALRAIFETLAGAGGFASASGPGRWHVLFGGRQRPLLMSDGDYKLQKQWLSYFIGDRMRTAYARALLKLNSVLPRVHFLPDIGFPAPRAAHAPGTPYGALAAIQIGTPGPYQKASALLITGAGEGLALAKIALVPGADRMVASEASWLRLLETERRLAGEVPQLLAEGDLGNGRRFLVMTLAPMTMTTTEFTPAHERFLRRLGRSRMDIRSFRSSSCCDSLERAYGDVASSMTRREALRLGSALHDCRLALSDFVCPFIFSQGDFAWWNIRVHRDGIFVFDWEYARLGANPLGDLFHYHLIQRAASGRAIGRWFLARVLREAESFARRQYPESKWQPARVTGLALAYVLDVLFQYCRANGGRIDPDDLVVQGYWSLVERRSTWMAS
jgi:hypothetical protein